MGKRATKWMKGCGCLLTGAGALLVLLSLVIVFAMYEADEDAGKSNKAQWQEYEEWVAQVDSLQDEAMRDSLMAERPMPVIRQGGFATLFGLMIGAVGVFVAVLLIVAGRLMVCRSRKRALAEESEWGKENVFNEKT